MVDDFRGFRRARGKSLKLWTDRSPRSQRGWNRLFAFRAPLSTPFNELLTWPGRNDNGRKNKYSTHVHVIFYTILYWWPCRNSPYAVFVRSNARVKTHHFPTAVPSTLCFSAIRPSRHVTVTWKQRPDYCVFFKHIVLYSSPANSDNVGNSRSFELNNGSSDLRCRQNSSPVWIVARVLICF